MAKMINVDELIEFCNTERAMLHARGNSVTCAVLRRVVEFAKEYAVEAEPVKHGRWKITENVLSYEGTFDFIGCSKCGKGFLNDLCENNGADFVNVENDFLFCPFCGSKNRMDGESE